MRTKRPEELEVAGEKVLRVEKVAEQLQVHPQTVRRYIKDGKLKAVKIGSAFYIAESELKEFIRGHTTSTNNPSNSVKSE